MYKLVKARLYPTDKEKEAFYVQFNPNTLEYTVGASSPKNVDEKNTSGNVTEQSGWAVLSMKLFFHSYRSETDYDDVRKSIHRLRCFLGRRENGQYVAGPQVTFAWGTITLDGHMEEMRVSYQMFAADGTPVQAEVEIKLVGEDRDVRAEGVNHAQAIQVEEMKHAAFGERPKDGGKVQPRKEAGYLFAQ